MRGYALLPDDDATYDPEAHRTTFVVHCKFHHSKEAFRVLIPRPVVSREEFSAIVMRRYGLSDKDTEVRSRDRDRDVRADSVLVLARVPLRRLHNNRER